MSLATATRPLSRLLSLALLLPFLLAGTAQAQWINEIHYDNTSTDVSEAVEVVLPSTADPSDFDLYLYNGNGGVVYGESPYNVGTFTLGDAADGFTIYYAFISGIQNGAPDGLALTQNGTLIPGQFLSYEGTFEATDGPAAGVTSTDIGVSEEPAPEVGQSLQLTGTGQAYADFTWTGPAADSFGSLNTGQAISEPSGNPVVAFTTTAASAAEGETAEMTVSISYPDGTPDGLPVTVAVNFDPDTSTAAVADFSNLTAEATFTGTTDGEEVTFSLDLTADDGEEGDEVAAFDLVVTSGTADLGAASTFTLTIEDGDGEPLALTFGAVLSGEAEVPDVETAASGSVTAELDGDQLVVTGTFTGLQSDYNQDIGSHIHGAAPGENGGIVFPLTPTLDGDNRGGTFEAAANTFTLTSAQVDSLIAGLYYVNVHSETNPGGEIRGQLVLPIAEARTLGVGTTVGVRGTVTRAMGAFTYFQDETAGLAIRQTDGAFFDAVANGTIAPGTELVVSGALSAFRGLLQINTTDLEAYDTVGMVDVPEPQTITLAELIANGEDYEAELVEVTALTTDAEGDFSAATSYDVGDPTTALSDNNILRVPNASDSDVDGTPIPEEAFTFTGVVGQFTPSSSGPEDEGYQLLAIEATDIVAGAVSNEGGATATAFALGGTFPNPASASATLRYDLPADAEVRLVVYDVLGREVMRTAQAAAAGAGRTVALETGALPAGLYLYRLTAEMATETKSATGRMTVVR